MYRPILGEFNDVFLEFVIGRWEESIETRSLLTAFVAPDARLVRIRIGQRGIPFPPSLHPSFVNLNRRQSYPSLNPREVYLTMNGHMKLSFLSAGAIESLERFIEIREYRWSLSTRIIFDRLDNFLSCSGTPDAIRIPGVAWLLHCNTCKSCFLFTCFVRRYIFPEISI